jgi:hypothetical protein
MKKAELGRYAQEQGVQVNASDTKGVMIEKILA